MNSMSQTNLRRLLLDGLAGLSLVLALALIFVLAPRRAPLAMKEVHQLDAGIHAAAEEPVLERPLKLAVTHKEYDDMGKM